MYICALILDVKITNFRDVFEARTVDWSSLHRLVHPYDSLVSKGIAEIEIFIMFIA